MVSRTAGLIHGQCEHYLDHLAPLCALLNVPLIVTDEEIARLTHIYYPMVELIELHPHHFAFEVVAQFDTLLTTLPQALLAELLFFAEKLLDKQLTYIWCPHGNSDKGHASELMEALAQEKKLFVYGQKMVDFLQAKGVYDQQKTLLYLGNYRQKFAEKHRSFFRLLLESKIPRSFNRQNPTLLFAPTWNDREHSSSFFDAFSILIEQLPSHFNLIIKPHPNLKHQHEGRAFQLLSAHEKKSALWILQDFPPIYPLLEITDVYIGDMSSIGYDFLAFNKPMFFLNQNKRDFSQDPGLYLFRCGIEVHPSNYINIYSMIQNHLDQDQTFSDIRREVYTYCFGQERALLTLKQEIENLLQS